jgi:hypothetical protein
MFHVTEPHISTLRIQRCSQEKNANPQLTLSGMSTYIGTRVDEWQNMQKPKEGSLWIGENVVIRPDIIQSSWARPAGQSFSRTRMDGREQMLHRHFNDMDRTPIHAPSFWQQWSGCIAGILGLAAGSAKLLGGFDAAAKGVYLQYQFGLFSKATFAAGSASLKVRWYPLSWDPRPCLVSESQPRYTLCRGIPCTPGSQMRSAGCGRRSRHSGKNSRISWPAHFPEMSHRYPNLLDRRDSRYYFYDFNGWQRTWTFPPPDLSVFQTRSRVMFSPNHT